MKNSNKIYVFDLDDTLVVTEAKIRVYDSEDLSLLHALTPQEFNYFNKSHHHILDFDQFECLKTLSEGKLIPQNVKILKKAQELGYPVAIVTARGNQPAVIEFLKKKKLNIDPSLVYATSDPSFNYSGSIPNRKLSAFKDLVKKGYDDFIYYDDSVENLEIIKKYLTKQGLAVSTFHV